VGRKRYTPEQIVHLLREAEVLLSRGRTVPKMYRELGLSAQTYYRWRRTYGGLGVNHARRPKELERENARLKRLAGEQALDIAVLKEASRGNSWARRGRPTSRAWVCQCGGTRRRDALPGASRGLLAPAAGVRPAVPPDAVPAGPHPPTAAQSA